MSGVLRSRGVRCWCSLHMAGSPSYTWPSISPMMERQRVRPFSLLAWHSVSESPTRIMPQRARDSITLTRSGSRRNPILPFRLLRTSETSTMSASSP